MKDIVDEDLERRGYFLQTGSRLAVTLQKKGSKRQLKVSKNRDMKDLTSFSFHSTMTVGRKL